MSESTAPPPSALGAMLRRRREGLGLSLREAARRIGISPSYLVSLEHGRNPTTGRAPMPSPPILASIGQVLGVDPAALLALAGAPASRSVHLLLYQTGTARPSALAGARRAFGSVEKWVDVGGAHACEPGRALADILARRAERGSGRRTGLIFGAGADPLGSTAGPEAVLDSEATWEDDVAAALGERPAANVCVYREADVRALTRVDPLTTAVSLIRSHPHVAVQDSAGAVTTGPAAVEAILAGLRPAGVGSAAWASLAAAAGAGFGRGPAAASAG